MELRNKHILIISPQSWHKVKLSKHHYALSLAALGNQVYFLNPPDTEIKDLVIEQQGDRLHLISYRPFFNLALRFRFAPLYQLLVRIQVRRIRKRLAKSFDLVWCFDPNLYPDLSVFGAPVKIFHPVDVFTHRNALRVAGSADIIFSVSPSILRFFEGLRKPMYFINHGLGAAFLQLATATEHTGMGSRNICYIGNLLIPYLDRTLMRSLIEELPDRTFHLIGPYHHSHSSLGGGDAEAEAFVAFLQSCRNVVLYGAKDAAEMITLMKGMDAFILCYTGRKEGYDLSNSHKMLEYLSTGKPVISTPVEAYKAHTGLIYMPEGEEESQYAAFFVDAIRERIEKEDPSLAPRRRKLAAENSYVNQVNRIAKLLEEHRLI